MLCPDSKHTSPLTAAHTTPLGTLIISSPHVSCAWLRCWLAQLQLAAQTCNAHHTCTVPDPCNAELPICTRLCIICNGSGSRPQFCIACNSATCAASSTSDITLPCYSGSRSHACSLETHCSCTASCISRRFVFVSDNLPNVLKTSVSR